MPAPDVTRDVERLVKLDELRPSAAHGMDEMRLELAPEGLGRIELRVAVRADAVHATLYANHDHAREALEAHRPTLEAALGRSHLRLEGFNVGLGQQQSGHGDLREGWPGRAVAAQPAAAAPAPAPALEPIPSAGGLSLRA